jgi:Tetratricopeptide repeat
MVVKQERVLDLIGTLEGTNKGSTGQGYLNSYEDLLRPLRHENFTLLEIGVFDGASLRMWKNYFPNASIVGIDVNPQCVKYSEDRISVEIGSQDDPELLDRVMRRHRPSVVLDDGSHFAHHILTSFERIFPSLEDGGLYIIEDTEGHFSHTAKHHQGLAKIALGEYFFGLAKNNLARQIDPDANHGLGKYLFDRVESIAFLKGSIVIRKISMPPSRDEVAAAAEAIASRSNSPRYWSGVAGILSTHGGPWDRAEKAIRKAIEDEPTAGGYHFRLGKILAEQGRVPEAIAALILSLQSPEGWPIGLGMVHAWYALGELQGRAGDYRSATDSLRKAVALAPNSLASRAALSRALEQMGNLAEAMVEAERAVVLVGDAPDAPRFRAQLDRLKQLQESAR